MKDISSKSEVELWELLRAGDYAAFELLYQRHIGMMYNYGLKLSKDSGLVKDVIQELFTEFWLKRQALSSVSNVNVYLIKSLRYKLLRAIQISNRKSTVDIDSLINMPYITEELEQEISIERRGLLKAELLNLPERQKEILHLKYFQNLSNEQISEIANINYQSVSNLLYRALGSLKKKLLV